VAAGPHGPKSAEHRQRMSEVMKASERQKAAHDRVRGIPRGPLSDETRAKMAASKRGYTVGSWAWEEYRRHYLAGLRLQREIATPPAG
jgi:hypothetical protein